MSNVLPSQRQVIHRRYQDTAKVIWTERANEQESPFSHFCYINRLPTEKLLDIFSKIDGSPQWPTLVLVCPRWLGIIMQKSNLDKLEGIRTPIAELELRVEPSERSCKALLVFKQKDGELFREIGDGIMSWAMTTQNQIVVENEFFVNLEEAFKRHKITNFTLCPYSFTEEFFVRLCKVLEKCSLLPLITFRFFTSAEGNVSIDTLCRLARTTGSLMNCPPFMITNAFMKSKGEGRGGKDQSVIVCVCMGTYQPLDPVHLLNIREFRNVFSICSLVDLIDVAKKREGPFEWKLSISESESELRLITLLYEITHPPTIPSSFSYSPKNKDDIDLEIWVHFENDHYEAKISRFEN